MLNWWWWQVIFIGVLIEGYMLYVGHLSLDLCLNYPNQV